MPKAILVIDMPSNCKECRFFQELWEEDALGYCKDYKCIFGCSHIGCFVERPKDCPLKLVPGTKHQPQYQGNGIFGYKTAMEHEYARGWNECINYFVDKQK